MLVSDHCVLPVPRDSSGPNNFELGLNPGFIALVYLSKNAAIFPGKTSLETGNELQWFKIWITKTVISSNCESSWYLFTSVVRTEQCGLRIARTTVKCVTLLLCPVHPRHQHALARPQL